MLSWTQSTMSNLTHRVLFLCFSLLLLWGLEAPKVCILDPPFLSFCRLLIRLSLATSMALRVSLLIGNLAPSMGVSANKKCWRLWKSLAPQKLTATLLLSVHQGSLVLAGESEESLLEGDVQRADGSLLVVAGPLQVLDGLPVRQSVAGSAVTVVVAV